MHRLRYGAVGRAGLAVAAVMVAMGCSRPEPAFDAEAEERAIRDVLERQVAAWNAGDIEGFMEGYARTDSLRFASGGSVRYGWQTTLERYRTAYPNREAMGRLSFDDLAIRVLSPRWATAFGRWHLQREGDYDEAGGLFTLILEKRPEGWRILYDHTSSGG